MAEQHIDGLLSSAYGWNAINWQTAIGIVKRLQARIVKAVKAGDKSKVCGLQRLLRQLPDASRHLIKA
ncbi:group II intron reverse transcriptase/maturase [Desulfonema ishimotonii]|uniref:Group II intron reverse transcriptase/maturase n=1 Tax=Desulfonema ishimotonii TaxID=45657 RepID=A0A401G1D6_9BACT|nr:reverse transcriptase N-terminal domain-containing protein [Desulfonema ishimotonii]GBC63025.1 group II intron reverse transcriptase/maturase [Desulfonema ishimotonii]